MQKYYTSSGRLVIHDEISKNIYRVRYVNDAIARPTPKDFLFHSESLDSLISSGSLRPYTPTIQKN